MKSIFKTVFFITIFSVITKVLGFLFKIYLSRELGAEALGVYQVAISLFMVLATIVSSGLPVVISKLTAKYFIKKDTTAEGHLVGTSLVISVITSAILVLIVVLFKNMFSNLYPESNFYPILLVLLPAVVFNAIYCVFRGAMWGRNNYFCFCLTELVEQVCRIAICVFMLSFGLFSLSPTISAGLSLSIASFIALIVTMIVYFILGGKIKKPNGIYKDVLRSSVPITGVRVALSLVQPIIALILPARLISAGYTSSQAMELFGIASGMTLPFLFIPVTLVGSLSTVLIPDISAAVATENKNYVNSRISSSVIFSILIAFLLVPLYIGAGENIGLFFYDNIESGRLLASAAWTMIPFSLLNITSSILNALGLELKSFINYIIGSVFMFVCLIVLPKYIGINSLVWALGSCVSVASLLNLLMITKKTGIKVSILVPFLKLILICIPTAALTFFTTSLLNNFMPLFFNLAISCTLGSLMFVLFCVVFQIFNVHAMFIEINKFFKIKVLKRKI